MNKNAPRFPKFSRFFAFLLKSKIRENNYKAKDMLIFICYAIIVLLALPSTIEHIRATQNPLDSSFANALNYAMIIFVPLVRLVVEFGANILGLCALFVCAILSVRYKILQNYIVLFVLYMACAYPSFSFLSVWEDMPRNLLSIANNDFLELLRLVFAKKAYYMVIFIYAKRVCYVFLFFALFDFVFFALKRDNRVAFYRAIPKIVWINLGFSIVLCVSSVLAYYFCTGEFICYYWLNSIMFLFGL